jgi:hypothetical protein
MKSAAQTKKQPSKETAKATREASQVHRTEKVKPQVRPETTRPAPANGNGNGATPMPDLTAFGVDPHAAQAHVAQCEQCGRAHRHVMKNPKDAMALESFGRNISVCLAGKQASA